MQTSEILLAWRKILRGEAPTLSIEITRECPLRCPGCYAYEPQHLGGGVTLRELQDAKGDELVAGVLKLVEKYKPLHLSLVGGDPLVRYRELNELVPVLIAKGIHLQIVTSAFRTFPIEWNDLPRLVVSVSIDGLPADHDVRRAPATYERILKNIEGRRVTIHSTITSQTVRPGYWDEFLQFWTVRPEIERVWFSIFTPQRGEKLPEILTPAQRTEMINELFVLRKRYPKLDMAPELIQQFGKPPASPDDCIFAQTTATVSADFRTKITPCQFGGNPDCSQCGCIASMGLAAIADHKLGGFFPIKPIFDASVWLGKRRSGATIPVAKPVFDILKT